MESTLVLQLGRDGILDLSEYHNHDSRMAKMHAFNKRREAVAPAIGTARTNIFPTEEASASPKSTTKHFVAEGVSMRPSN